MGRICTTVDDEILMRFKAVAAALGTSESVLLRSVILKELTHIHHVANKLREGADINDIPEFFIDVSGLNMGALDWFRIAEKLERSDEDKQEKIYRYKNRRTKKKYVYQSVSIPEQHFDFLRKVLGIPDKIPTNVLHYLVVLFSVVWMDAIATLDDLKEINEHLHGDINNEEQESGI